MPLFQEFEFKSLISKLPKNLQTGDYKSMGQDSFSFDGQTKTSSKSNVDYKLIKTEADFKKFILELKSQKIFALDTETSGVKPFVDELLGISFCWQDGHAYYLPVSKSWLEQIKPILENPEIKKIELFELKKVIPKRQCY